MCAVHSPMPLTATSSRDDLLVGQLVERVDLQLAGEHVLGQRAQRDDFARERPAAARSASGSSARSSAGVGARPPKRSISRP